MHSTINIADDHKLVLLQNAVHDVKELRAVKVQADQFKVQTSHNLDFDQYLKLLKSAAISRDTALQPKHSLLTKRCSVYIHDVDGYGEVETDATYPEFDLDTSLLNIQAYVASR
jgi:hypothetical protein